MSQKQENFKDLNKGKEEIKSLTTNKVNEEKKGLKLFELKLKIR